MMETIFGLAAAMAKGITAMPSIVVPVVITPVVVPTIIPPMVVAIGASFVMTVAVVILGGGDGRDAQAGDDQARGGEHP